MKRFILATVIALLALSFLPAQGTELQLAVATQALNQEMLEKLGVPQVDIDEILAVQNNFQMQREETAILMNVIKAQIAEKLYYPDTPLNDVEKLLEKASELRLEQEVSQVRNYQQVREYLGEENWTKLMQAIRIRTRQKLAEQTATSTQTRQNQPETGSSGNNSAASGSSGSGSSGSTNRR